MTVFNNLLLKLNRKDQDRLALYISCMPERHRNIIELSLRGISQTDIGKALGMPQGNVSRTVKQIHRALIELEKEYVQSSQGN